RRAVIGGVVEHLIKPGLTLDQEIEPPLAKNDVEGEKKTDPAGNGAGAADALAHQRAALALIEGTGVPRPGIDEGGDGAGHRRPCGEIEQAGDELRHERAHRGELQTDIALIGEASVARDLSVHLLAPTLYLIGGELLVGGKLDDAGNEPRDLRARII